MRFTALPLLACLLLPTVLLADDLPSKARSLDAPVRFSAETQSVSAVALLKLWGRTLGVDIRST
ncbi:MAG: hypothetical protein JKY65_01180 [Planctomycetes bacterium]|nr:hypothetical protein [Planctomycetota bacterium]